MHGGIYARLSTQRMFYWFITSVYRFGRFRIIYNVCFEYLYAYMHRFVSNHRFCSRRGSKSEERSSFARLTARPNGIDYLRALSQ